MLPGMPGWHVGVNGLGMRCQPTSGTKPSYCFTGEVTVIAVSLWGETFWETVFGMIEDATPAHHLAQGTH
jgi:hypothetical protein